MDIPWAFDKRSHYAFVLLNMIDLNMFPMLLQPIGVTDRKEVGCLCCADGVIDIQFNVLKSNICFSSVKA
jgi:hypothetical protein